MTMPQCSIMLRTFAPEDPGGWHHIIDLACAADAAGIDRLVMSDHVVVGEDLEAYADPGKGGSAGGGGPGQGRVGGRTPADGPRRSLARPRGHDHVPRRAHDARTARDQH